MTVGPIGTPDWSKSVPGGTHVLLDVSVNVPTAEYISPLISCLAYNGLYMELFLTGGVGNFMQVRVEFYDDPTGTVATTSTFAVAVQNNTVELNHPVLGPYCKVHLISSVAATITASRVMLIGHNGGPAASVRVPIPFLVEYTTGSLAAGAGATTNIKQMTEGLGFLTANNNNQPGYAQVTAGDQNGTQHQVGIIRFAGANQSGTIAIPIPPYPLQLTVVNQGTVADGYTAVMWIHRA